MLKRFTVLQLKGVFSKKLVNTLSRSDNWICKLFKSRRKLWRFPVWLYHKNVVSTHPRTWLLSHPIL